MSEIIDDIQAKNLTLTSNLKFLRQGENETNKENN